MASNISEPSRMKMVKKSITVTAQQESWIQAQVASGNYASDSEIIREALREKASRAADIEAIRARLIASEESGLSQRTPKQIREDVKKQLSEDG